MAEPPVLLTEPLAGRYRIARRIGTGAMAEVFLASDLVGGCAVAVKVLKAQYARAVGAERFHREIALLRDLQHPNIVSLLDSGQVGSRPFYVMPLAADGSLRARLGRGSALPLPEIRRIAREVAAALDAAHAQGVLHRDVKPENIVFEGARVLVCDFGIARAVTLASGEPRSSSGLVVGTPGYMSPEQAAGDREVSRPADVYGLACVTFEMVAGTPPFTGRTARAVLARHLATPPPAPSLFRPGLPPAMERAILAGLAKRPDDRPATAGLFAARLED
jgi:serine/threonine-protein kinase